MREYVLPFGNVQSYFLAPSPDAPLIIHIQDVHDIEEAQKNSASIIQRLNDQRGVRLVGLEGAEGAFALDPYRAYPNSDVRKSVAGFLLKAGYIGGAEFVGMATSNPPILWGVEDFSLYEKNIEDFKSSASRKARFLSDIGRLKAAVEGVKAKVFSEDLKGFDQRFMAYHRHSEELGSYIEFLLSLTPTGEGRFSTLRLFSDAVQKEKTLDFKAVEKERLELLRTIASRLTESELGTLTQHGLLLKSGRISFADFDRFLQVMCHRRGISLEKFEKLSAYRSYQLAVDSIDAKALFAELSVLEDSAQNSLAFTQDQKELISVIRDLVLVEKLVENNMTTMDWDNYEKKRSRIYGVPQVVRRLDSKDVTPLSLWNPSEFKNALDEFERFYRDAVQRNEAIAQNLLRKMRKEQIPSAVLVAGGFHTDGITEYLKRKNVSYFVVTPRISSVPTKNSYLDVFVRDPLPLEKLFGGEVINLISPRITANRLPEVGNPGRREIAESLTASLAPLLQLGLAEGEAKKVFEILRESEKLAGNFPTIDELKIEIEKGMDSPMRHRVLRFKVRRGAKEVSYRILLSDNLDASKAALKNGGLVDDDAIPGGEIRFDEGNLAAQVYRVVSIGDSFFQPLRHLRQLVGIGGKPIQDNEGDARISKEAYELEVKSPAKEWAWFLGLPTLILLLTNSTDLVVWGSAIGGVGVLGFSLWHTLLIDLRNPDLDWKGRLANLSIRFGVSLGLTALYLAPVLIAVHVWPDATWIKTLALGIGAVAQIYSHSWWNVVARRNGWPTLSLAAFPRSPPTTVDPRIFHNALALFHFVETSIARITTGKEESRVIYTFRVLSELGQAFKNPELILPRLRTEVRRTDEKIKRKIYLEISEAIGSLYRNARPEQKMSALRHIEENIWRYASQDTDHYRQSRSISGIAHAVALMYRNSPFEEKTEARRFISDILLRAALGIELTGKSALKERAQKVRPEAIAGTLHALAFLYEETEPDRLTEAADVIKGAIKQTKEQVEDAEVTAIALAKLASVHLNLFRNRPVDTRDQALREIKESVIAYLSKLEEQTSTEVVSRAQSNIYEAVAHSYAAFPLGGEETALQRISAEALQPALKIKDEVARSIAVSRIAGAVAEMPFNGNALAVSKALAFLRDDCMTAVSAPASPTYISDNKARLEVVAKINRAIGLLHANTSNGQTADTDQIKREILDPQNFEVGEDDALSRILSGSAEAVGRVFKERDRDQGFTIIRDEILPRVLAIENLDARFRGLSRVALALVTLFDTSPLAERERAIDFIRNELLSPHLESARESNHYLKNIVYIYRGLNRLIFAGADEPADGAAPAANVNERRQFFIYLGAYGSKEEIVWHLMNGEASNEEKTALVFGRCVFPHVFPTLGDFDLFFRPLTPEQAERLAAKIQDDNITPKDISELSVLVEVEPKEQSWAGIAGILQAISRSPLFHLSFIRYVILTLRIKRTRGEPLLSAFNIEMIPKLTRAPLADIFADAEAFKNFYSDLKLMLRAIPLDAFLINEIRIKVNNWYRDSPSKEPFVEKLRRLLHDSPSPYHLEILRAYARYLESRNEEDRDDLNRVLAPFGVSASPEYLVDIEEAYEEAKTAVVEMRDLYEDLYGTQQARTVIRLLYADRNQHIPPAIADRTVAFLNEISRIQIQLPIKKGLANYYTTFEVANFSKEKRIALLSRLTALKSRIQSEIESPLTAADNRVYLVRLQMALDPIAFGLLSSLRESWRDLTPGERKESLTLGLKLQIQDMSFDESREEMGVILKELEDVSYGVNPRRDLAILTRLERLSNNLVDQTSRIYQARAEHYADVVQFEHQTIRDFAADIVRESTLFGMGLLTETAITELSEASGFSTWRITRVGQATGNLLYVEDPSQIDSITFRGNEILVVDRIPPDKPIPNVRGIITRSKESPLTHLAIMAGYRHIPWASPSPREFKEIVAQCQKGGPVDFQVLEKGVRVAPTASASAPGQTRRAAASHSLAPIESGGATVLRHDGYALNSVGPKAFKLGLLTKKLGEIVPAHVAIPFHVFKSLVDREPELASAIQTIPSLRDEGEISNRLRTIRRLIANIQFPDEMKAEIREAVRHVIGEGKPLMVRSTTNVEDLEDYPGAGVYESVVSLDPANLFDDILKVYASFYSEKAFAERSREGFSEAQANPAVLIQELFEPDYAFVIHTRNPNSTDPDEMLIEIVLGHGEALVSSQPKYDGDPHQFSYNRRTGEIERLAYANKSYRSTPKGDQLIDYSLDPLSREEIPSAVNLKALFEMAREVESDPQIGNGRAQDIEGAMQVRAAGSRSAFVQTRNQPPVTALESLSDLSGDRPLVRAPTPVRSRPLDQYPPVFHPANVGREQYDLPKEIFGGSANLVDLWLKAFEEGVGPGRIILTPYGSLSYLFENGAVRWDHVKDLDLMFYVTGTKNPEEAWEFETAHFENVKEAFIRLAREAGLTINVSDNGSFSLAGSLQGQPVSLEMKSANLKLLPINEIGRGEIKERQPGGYLYWHRYFGDDRATRELEKLLRVDRELSQRRIVRNAEEQYRFVYDRGAKDDDYRKIKELFRISLVIDDNNLNQTAVRLLRGYEESPSGVSAQVNEAWSQLPKPGSEALRRRLTEIVEAQTRPVHGLTGRLHDDLANQQIAAEYNAYYTYGFGEQNRLVEMVTDALLKAYFSGAKLYLIATAPYPDLLGQVKKRATSLLSAVDTAANSGKVEADVDAIIAETVIDFKRSPDAAGKKPWWSDRYATLQDRDDVSVLDILMQYLEEGNRFGQEDIAVLHHLDTNTLPVLMPLFLCLRDHHPDIFRFIHQAADLAEKPSADREHAESRVNGDLRPAQTLIYALQSMMRDIRSQKMSEEQAIRFMRGDGTPEGSVIGKALALTQALLSGDPSAAEPLARGRMTHLRDQLNRLSAWERENRLSQVYSQSPKSSVSALDDRHGIQDIGLKYAFAPEGTKVLIQYAEAFDSEKKRIGWRYYNVGRSPANNAASLKGLAPLLNEIETELHGAPRTEKNQTWFTKFHAAIVMFGPVGNAPENVSRIEPQLLMEIIELFVDAFSGAPVDIQRFKSHPRFKEIEQRLRGNGTNDSGTFGAKYGGYEQLFWIWEEALAREQSGQPNKILTLASENAGDSAARLAGEFEKFLTDKGRQVVRVPSDASPTEAQLDQAGVYYLLEGTPPQRTQEAFPNAVRVLVNRSGAGTPNTHGCHYLVNVDQQGRAQMSALSDPDPYMSERYRRREFEALEEAYAISKDIGPNPQIMLLIGVGRGMTALELALRNPSLSIWAVNKEEGLWDDGAVEQRMREKGYTPDAITEARGRIHVKVLDVENPGERQKAFGDQKFDFVVYELWTQVYFQDQVGNIEDLFNERMARGGVLASTLNSVTISRERYDADEDMNDRRKPDQGLVDAVKTALGQSSNLTHENDVKGTPYLKFRRTSDEPVEIPLTHIAGRPQSLPMGLTFRVSLYGEKPRHPGGTHPILVGEGIDPHPAVGEFVWRLAHLINEINPLFPREDALAMVDPDALLENARYIDESPEFGQSLLDALAAASRGSLQAFGRALEAVNRYTARHGYVIFFDESKNSFEPFMAVPVLGAFPHVYRDLPFFVWVPDESSGERFHAISSLFSTQVSAVHAFEYAQSVYRFLKNAPPGEFDINAPLALWQAHWGELIASKSDGEAVQQMAWDILETWMIEEVRHRFHNVALPHLITGNPLQSERITKLGTVAATRAPLFALGFLMNQAEGEKREFSRQRQSPSPTELGGFVALMEISAALNLASAVPVVRIAHQLQDARGELDVRAVEPVAAALLGFDYDDMQLPRGLISNKDTLRQAAGNVYRGLTGLEPMLGTLSSVSTQIDSLKQQGYRLGQDGLFNPRFLKRQDVAGQVEQIVQRIDDGLSIEEIIRPYIDKVPGITPDQISDAEKEVSEIHNQIRQLLASREDRAVVDRAFALCLVLHADQPRASKGDSRPYVIHVAGVVKTLVEEFQLLNQISNPEEVRDVIAAAWLHDTVEDGKKGRWGKRWITDLALGDADLRQEIGAIITALGNANIRHMVDSLSKPDYEGFALNDEIAIEARYYVDLAGKPLGTQLIKAADFSFNLGDLRNHPDRAFPKKFFTKRLAPVLGFLPVGKVSDQAKARLVQFVRASVDENNRLNAEARDAEKAPPVLTEEQETLLRKAEITVSKRREIQERVNDLSSRVSSGQPVREAIRPYLEGVPGVTPDQVANAEMEIADVHNQTRQLLSDPADRAFLDRAFSLAVILHADQPRASKGDSRPYVIHIAGVVKMVVEEFQLLNQISDPAGIRDVIAAAWLHDAVEDGKKGRWGKGWLADLALGDADLREEIGAIIAKTCNANVRHMVDSLSKPDYEGFALTDEIEIEARYYVDLAGKPLGTQLIKAADFSFNLGDLKNHPNRAFPKKFFTKRLAPVLGFLPVGKISDEAKGSLVKFIRASVDENNRLNAGVGDAEKAPSVLTEEQEKILQHAESKVSRRREIRESVNDLASMVSAGQPIGEAIRPYLERVPGVTPDQIASAELEVAAIHGQTRQLLTDPTDRALLDRAFALGVILHADQPRASKGDSRPYIIHVAGVVKLLVEEFNLVGQVTSTQEVRDILAAAWLHDTIEDGKKGRWGKSWISDLSANDEDLRAEIGQVIEQQTNLNIRHMVQSLSKPDYEGFALTDEVAIEARYYVELADKPLGTQLVKAADFSFNLGDLKNHPDRAFPRKFFTKRLGPVLGFLPVGKISSQAKGRLVQFIRESVEENNQKNTAIGDPDKAPPALTDEQEDLLKRAEQNIRMESKRNEVPALIDKLVSEISSGKSIAEAIRPYLEAVPGVTADQISDAQRDVSNIHGQTRQLVSPEHRALVDRAFALGVVLHADQPRASKGDSRPYIIHIAGVVKFLVEEFQLTAQVSSEEDVRDILAAAWLHDAVEDGKKGRWGKSWVAEINSSDTDLRKEIGQIIAAATNPNVRHMVESLSKPDYEGFAVADEAVIEARYYVELGEKPLGTQLVKAADFSFNLGDLKNHPDRAFPKKFFFKRLGPVLGFLPVGKISQQAKARLVQFIRTSVDENNQKNLGIGDAEKAPPVLTDDQERLLRLAEEGVGKPPAKPSNGGGSTSLHSDLILPLIITVIGLGGLGFSSSVLLALGLGGLALHIGLSPPSINKTLRGLPVSIGNGLANAVRPVRNWHRRNGRENQMRQSQVIDGQSVKGQLLTELSASFLGGPAGPRTLRLTQFNLNAEMVRDQALHKLEEAREINRRLASFFDEEDQSPAGRIAGLLLDQPHPQGVEEIFSLFAEARMANSFLIDEWNRRAEGRLNPSLLGVAAGRSDTEKAEADLRILSILIAGRVGPAQRAELNDLFELGVTAFNRRMRVEEALPRVQSNIDAKKPSALELSPSIVQGRIQGHADEGILNQLLLLARANKDGEDSPAISLLLPERLTENDLLLKLIRIHPDLKTLRGRVIIIDKATVLDKQVNKYSVDRLVALLEQRGIFATSGLDLFILSRREWTDPDRSSLIKLLVILTGELVYDATTKVDQDLRELAYIKLQA